MTRPEEPQCLLFRPCETVSEENLQTLNNRLQEYLLASPTAFGENLTKLWFEQISFPRACLSHEVDVAHVPYFAAPIRSRSRTVVTIHDLIPLILPAYRGSILVRSYTRLVAAGAKRADAVITDSESSRRDITNLLGIPPSRVHVIHLAASRIFNPVRDAQELERIRHKYSLPKGYILYLGGFDQRKNLKTLLRAYAETGQRSSLRAELVIAGALPERDSPFFPDPRLMVERWSLGKRVSFIGWVPEEDKPALYSEAALFVFPSYYEGFGLPPLEAMSCGTAAITSDRGSLPEVVGEGAMLVDPENVGALARAMTTLLENTARRQELAAEGLKRARLFSWEKTVAETIQVYESLR